MRSVVAEACLTNSFDDSSAYRLYRGVHRIACLDGLVCPIGDLGWFSDWHSGGEDFNRRIIEVSYRVV